MASRASYDFDKLVNMLMDGGWSYEDIQGAVDASATKVKAEAAARKVAERKQYAAELADRYINNTLREVDVAAVVNAYFGTNHKTVDIMNILAEGEQATRAKTNKVTNEPQWKLNINGKDIPLEKLDTNLSEVDKVIREWLENL